MSNPTLKSDHLLDNNQTYGIKKERVGGFMFSIPFNIPAW
jgi:hypothetical protein